MDARTDLFPVPMEEGNGQGREDTCSRTWGAYLCLRLHTYSVFGSRIVLPTVCDGDGALRGRSTRLFVASFSPRDLVAMFVLLLLLLCGAARFSRDECFRRGAQASSITSLMRGVGKGIAQGASPL
eukprot:scaffold71677_cov36-Tisochrysis_lutea.AAC.3